jgi:hypothetical protein
MDELPLHRHYLHYSELPYSQRVLYTATLLVIGFAYVLALLQIYFTYAGRAGGNPKMISYNDIVVGYSGNKTGSRLETALRGPMAGMVSSDQRQVIFNWLSEDSPRAAYDKNIKPIIDGKCMACHNGSNPHLPDLSDYDKLKKMTAVDTGPTIATLVRVSHIHLFGLTFIFFLMGTMFSHAYAAGVAEMYDCRRSVCCNPDRRQLLVHHQVLPSLCAGRDCRRHDHGGLFCLYVAGYDVAIVVQDDAAGGAGAGSGQAHHQARVTNARHQVGRRPEPILNAIGRLSPSAEL